jgi:hypothetical protein
MSAIATIVVTPSAAADAYARTDRGVARMLRGWRWF